LMKDQVDELNRRGIPSGALHSMLSAEKRCGQVSHQRRPVAPTGGRVHRNGDTRGP
jgi:hypothetical protein